MRGRRAGMTLAEVLVATFLLGIFGLTVAASLSLAMRQWQTVGQKVNAIQNARFVSTTIINEVRTAVPCPIPTMGWPSLAGVTQPTGIHMPNAITATSTNLTFMQPFNATWTPLAGSASGPSWSTFNSDSYRRVTYSMGNGNTVINRESFSFNGSGVATSLGVEPIATSTNITTSFTALAYNLVNVTVECQEGRYLARYQTNVQTVGR